VEVRRVMCPKFKIVRQEKLPWVSGNLTKRFAHYLGWRCENTTIKAVAYEFNLDWKTVKEADKEYMRAKLAKAPEIAPVVIGIDEFSRRKGHAYNIVVTDLKQKRAIWFEGPDRSEESLDRFYESLGSEKCSRIKLAVMDMWKAFENSTRKHAPQAAILYDKFHVLRHLGEALDSVRKSEYRRVSGKEQKFIKGQKYNLLSRWKNLNLNGRQALKELLKANRRLNTAYVLKESFSQLWDYSSAAWARKFFDHWRESLKWQRLKPFEEFSELIDRHWDGIVMYCKSEPKVALGFVEGLNNKIRVIQRRAYGLKDPEYFQLKVLTCMLPSLNYKNL
jgi:transposase